MTHLDKKTITIIIVCTLVGGIIGVTIGSFIGVRHNYARNGNYMMQGRYNTRYGRGSMMGGQGRYNQIYQQPNNQIQDQAPVSGTTTAN